MNTDVTDNVCTRRSKRLRAELYLLRERYDGGAVSPGIYQRIKELETQLAWCEHKQGLTRRPA